MIDLVPDSQGVLRAGTLIDPRVLARSLRFRRERTARVAGPTGTGFIRVLVRVCPLNQPESGAGKVALNLGMDGSLCWPKCSCPSLLDCLKLTRNPFYTRFQWLAVWCQNDPAAARLEGQAMMSSIPLSCDCSIVAGVPGPA